MALGETLRNAREQKGLTPSAVAESTHMKVQIIEDLEREDFRRIAAPIYGRGFVKLYAEALELDPEPLVRDFMAVYAGARAPAVRTRRVEAPAEVVQEGVPVTRTVTGAAPGSPQRQSVVAKPAVRPLSAPQIFEQEDEPTVVEELVEIEEEARADEDSAAAASEAAPDRLVVDPEEAYEDAFSEPDLFHPKPRPSAPVAKEASEPDDARRPKLPVFKIGGRLEQKAEPSAHDTAAHARRVARVQAFIDGFKSLRDGVESKLPAALPRKQMIALCGVGAAMVVCMAVGIGLLFKMTGSHVLETPGTVIEAVAPPPDLYVD